MTTHVGITIVDRGAAIVAVDHAEDGTLLCSAIERLPFDLGAVALRVRELEDTDARYVVDAEGLGSALWTVLGHADDEHWTLYAARGVERQALVDTLLVAIEQDRFRFAPALPEMDAMSKALSGYRRVVGADGVIGHELVVALLLALIPEPPEVVPLIAVVGRDGTVVSSMPPLEADAGTHVAGYRIVSGPSGALVGMREPRPRIED